MDEADRLCQRIGIIDHGQIIALDTPDKLKEQVKGDVITLETPDKERMDKLLEQCGWCKAIKKHGNMVTINVMHAETRLPEIIKLTDEHRIKLTSITITKPSLEDVYLHFTGRTIREEEANPRDNLRRRRRLGRGGRR
jgi:ABC-2 type transport system ATP-binding protein